MPTPSARAQIIARRSYSRPLDMDNPEAFETWPQTVGRAIAHQEWLWARQLGRALNKHERAELTQLEALMLERMALPAGRVLWLGGTDTSRRVEACLFNCAFTCVETVNDVVDVFWLLLNGCGVGFEPVPGCLFGFPTRIPEISVVRSTRGPEHRGRETNRETYDPATKTWTIECGDSARAWAKLPGKLLQGKHNGCQRLVLDFSEVRGAGGRLRGYGWICAGDGPMAEAMEKIVKILNDGAGRMLPFSAIHDLVNLLGTVLSTRRAAQLCQCPRSSPEWRTFATFKHNLTPDLAHRYQSNNSTNYDDPDPRGPDSLHEDLAMLFEGRVGEPAMRNLVEARRRAPWSRGTNPCAEILLPNKGFCNLVEVNLAHPLFRGGEGFDRLCGAIRLIARANYRQTCVDLRDGILQTAWHQNNQSLRLCGVGLTGVAQRPDLDDWHISHMRDVAVQAARRMSMELGTPFPQAVTTIKPSGTLSKIMDCSSGIHDEIAEYVFNRVVFSDHDPLLPPLRRAGYRIEPHPTSPGNSLVVLPVHFPGQAPAALSAVEQLDRYLRWNTLWADHNVSCTIYYRDDERAAIERWLRRNWSRGFLSVSFLPRPEVGQRSAYAYLPQEPVTRGEYEAYTRTLKALDLSDAGELVEPEPDCATGACPVR